MSLILGILNGFYDCVSLKLKKNRSCLVYEINAKPGKVGRSVSHSPQ